MEFFTIPSNVWFDYAVVGIIANIVSVVITFILVVIKSSFLTDSELAEYVKFAKTRKTLIYDRNSSGKIWLSFSLILLPMYALWINVIFCYYLIFKPGLWGLIKGSVQADRFAIIKLIDYEFVEIDK